MGFFNYIQNMPTRVFYFIFPPVVITAAILIFLQCENLYEIVVGILFLEFSFKVKYYRTGLVVHLEDPYSLLLILQTPFLYFSHC